MKENSPADDHPEKIGDHVTIFRRNTRWYANYQHDGKQYRKSLGTHSKKQARANAIRIEADLASGRLTHENRAPALQRVIDEYRAYLNTERRAKGTLAKYERAFGAFLALAARLKVKNILGINRRFVDAFRGERVANGAEPMTVHTDTVILRQIVNFALARDLINRDPLRGFKLKKPKASSQPCWTIEEVERILAAASEPQRSAFAVLADTGMRVGELKHLTWADVDFSNRVLHVREKPGWKPKTGDVRVITKGTAEAVVRRWVGHVDQQVMKRYTHVADKESRTAMDRLAREKVP